jgi:dipeptidyl aminopeptidase/acylaminoacyl peptidase
MPADGSSPARIDVADSSIDSVQVDGHFLCYLGGGPRQPRRLVRLDLQTGASEILKQSFVLGVDAGYLSEPEAITFPTSDGAVAHALYYPPTSAGFTGPADERPPLIVTIHGGPTSSVGSGLDLGKQLFTSRGFGVVDVNYRGSTGHGREYMRALDGQWGVADVDDCIAAARYLAERGEVDPNRMAIRGGSAGGFTTLAALAFHVLFAAGASFFGVGDLGALARDTHKYESRYMDRLIGPYPEAIDLYEQRSPIFHMDGISVPLLVLQGRDDMVVPIAQAEQIVAALRERQVPHAYLVFDGEGHGFRQAANIRRSLESELSFYAQVFGFELADRVEPIEVEFLA